MSINEDPSSLTIRSVLTETRIFPPPAELQRLEMLRDFDPKLRRTLSRMWTEIKVR